MIATHILCENCLKQIQAPDADNALMLPNGWLALVQQGEVEHFCSRLCLTTYIHKTVTSTADTIEVIR